MKDEAQESFNRRVEQAESIVTELRAQVTAQQQMHGEALNLNTLGAETMSEQESYEDALVRSMDTIQRSIASAERPITAAQLLRETFDAKLQQASREATAAAYRHCAEVAKAQAATDARVRGERTDTYYALIVHANWCEAEAQKTEQGTSTKGDTR